MQSKATQSESSAGWTTDADVEFVPLVTSMIMLMVMASTVMMLCTQRIAMGSLTMQRIARQRKSNQARV